MKCPQCESKIFHADEMGVTMTFDAKTCDYHDKDACIAALKAELEAIKTGLATFRYSYPVGDKTLARLRKHLEAARKQ